MMSHVSNEQHLIVNAKFALFAASGAVCPRLAAEHAFGANGSHRFAGLFWCGRIGRSRDRSDCSQSASRKFEGPLRVVPKSRDEDAGRYGTPGTD